MDKDQSPRLSDSGVSSVQFVLAAGLGLILFLVLANFVVVQYGRGAIRSALDQGARVGAVTHSTAGCEQRIDEVLDQLLGGTMGDSIRHQCEIGPDLVTARVSGEFPSWTPFSPDIAVDMTASAVVEVPQ